jgi:hypothetical protein
MSRQVRISKSENTDSKLNNGLLYKIISFVPGDRLAAFVALFVLAVMLVPLIRISVYAVPWYDDLNYGRFVKEAIENGAGIFGALKAAIECVIVQWYAWQGTYSSIFFMALMPAVWGEEYYFLGPLFLITLLTVSVYTLMRVTLKYVFGAEKYGGIAVSAVCTSICVMFIHTSQAGIYWYNGGVHYVGMHSMLLFLVALCIKMAYNRKKRAEIIYIPAAMLLAVLAAGSNYVTALQGLLILCGMAALVLVFKKTAAIKYIPVIIVYVYGFYKNVTAPGNAHRSASYIGWGYSPFVSVLRSFLEAFKHIGTFTGFRTLAVMIILLPIICRMVVKCRQNAGFNFKYPAVVLILSFCLYATGFTPSLYSLGHAGLARTLNAVKITFQILLILNEIYVTGWFMRRFEDKFDVDEAGILPFYVFITAAMIVIFICSPNQAGTYSSYAAYYYVHTGEAYNFHQEYEERIAELKSDEENVVLKEYVYTPWLLCMGDLGDNPDAEENVAVQAWYHKDSVIVK